tara:strand:+ start:598 stop:2607 length:2010 start_codon:yes stop_codon:yes gene_type:complete
MGGVAGHMAHVSEDLSLTFNEVVEILGKVARAEIEEASEKVDGQNLFLTVDAVGNARTARNSGDIKKGGMTTEEYVSKWRGHPAENAFTNGFRAIEQAISILDPDDVATIFGGGKRWVNMEIMYPKNPNIISYTAPQIVMHSLQDFSDGEKVDDKEIKQYFKHLTHAVDSEEVDVANEKWTINGPKIVKLQKLEDGTILDNATNKIEEFAGPVGMSATLEDLVKVYYRKLALRQGLPKPKVRDLLTLVFDPEEANKQEISLRSIKNGLSKEQKTVVSELGTKTNSRRVISKILLPLEKIISDFAIEALRGLKSFFVDDNDKEVARMRDELNKSINYLQALSDSGKPEMGELVDKQLAKLGDIENLASSMEGFVFEYPPGSGRIYKMTGAFAMSNQIIGRARRSGMQEEIVEDESDDPVVDSAYPKTVAVVPGAFKPPHKGHLDMVRSYANIADEVVVLISRPTKSGRKLPNGREITAEDSLKIWNVLAAGMPNVRVEISAHASPINAAYEYVGDEGPLNVGDKAILGCSNKGGDCKRWTGAEKYIKQGVELVPVTGVEPTARASGEPYSATDFRNALGGALDNRAEIADFVGEENVDDVLSILGLGNVEEMAAMAGGAVGGYAGPLGSTSDKPAKRDTKKKKQKQYIDLGLLAEVMKLIKERGIINETK